MDRNTQAARRVLIVFGTRPEAIKLAPVILRMKECARLLPVVAVTAQHREMLDQVLSLFRITPQYDLNIMRAEQTVFDVTARALAGLREVYEDARADLVLVQGDTTTVMAAALAAFYLKLPVGHVEAGLRSFDKYAPFPEEINRKLTTVLSDLHFAPTELSRRNLLAEGVPAERIFVTGNTAVDALLYAASIEPAPTHPILDKLDRSRRLVVVTTHRRENWGEPIRQVCRAIRKLVDTFDDLEVVYSLHLNPLVQNVARAELADLPNVHLLNALDYGPWVQVLKRATLILSDSGGIQEEAPSLNKPVLVLRSVTERPEGVTAGTLKIVGTDAVKIVDEAGRLLADADEYARMANAPNPYGDGHAADRIARVLAEISALH